jgi:hypothetical protein
MIKGAAGDYSELWKDFLCIYENKKYHKKEAELKIELASFSSGSARGGELPSALGGYESQLLHKRNDLILNVFSSFT